ncbi:MAG: hypothetical protein ACKO11_12625 [Cuspidothrix sp.]
MNYQPKKDLQRRLENLEAEIKSDTKKLTNGNNSVPPEAKTPVTDLWQWNLYLERFGTWFKSLSTLKKVVVTGVIMLLTVWILQTVFALVAAIISLAVLTVLVYLGYKFFVANSLHNHQ